MVPRAATAVLLHCGAIQAACYVGAPLRMRCRRQDFIQVLCACPGLQRKRSRTSSHRGRHLACKAGAWRSCPQRPSTTMEHRQGGSGSSTRTNHGEATSRSGRALRDEMRVAIDNLGWPPLLRRGWEEATAKEAADSVASSRGAAGTSHAQNLKVLSWNVLADSLSGSHPDKGGFSLAPEGSLDWDKRRWKILEELLKWDCDVIALQEVDHHHDWLSPMLAKAGYRSVFMKKPCAPGLAYNPSLEDGCSLFYRTGGSQRETDGSDVHHAGTGQTGPTQRTTLDLLDAHCFTFAVSEDGLDDDDSSRELAESADESSRVRSDAVVQNQVAIIALLRISQERAARGQDHEMNECLVVVATTHLKATKDRHGEVIRARQATQLLDEVTRFRAGQERLRGKSAGSIPLVIAGDFNATPHTSGVESRGGYEAVCFNMIVGHPLGLKSAFDVEDAFTTWKVRWASSAGTLRKIPAAGRDKPEGERATKESKHCIDYIWITDGVQTIRRSSVPTAEGLGPLRAPSFVYPSDHFAIAVDLWL